MINRIMKNNAMKSLQKDLDKLDRTRSYADVSVIADKSYIPDDTKLFSLCVPRVPSTLYQRVRFPEFLFLFRFCHDRKP